MRESISTEIPSTSSRVTPPKGVCFSKDRYVFRIERRFDQWGEVVLINSDNAPHRFIVKTATELEDIALGFIGKGSVDGICELGAGEWKRVRLVAMAAQAKSETYHLPIHLYDMDSKATLADALGRPHDEAEVVIEIAQPEFEVEINKVGEDPYTLAQTYEVVNRGALVTDLSVYPGEGLKNLVTFSPTIDKFLLDTGMPVQFTVAPVIHEDFGGLEGQIIVYGNGTEKALIGRMWYNKKTCNPPTKCVERRGIT